MKAGARADAVVGPHGDGWKVSVRAPRERGRANEAVVALLAEALGLPRAAVRIVGGAAAPSKTIKVEGLDAAEAAARLARAASARG